MEHLISNGELSLSVAENGAEMMSLKKDGAEYLWQGDPEFWSGRAYNLFPVCGRLTDGKYTFKGKTYEMMIHGFAKLSPFTLAEKGENFLTFTLKSNEETKKMYPFDFILTVKYTLKGNCVHTDYSVKNTGDGKMYFTLGGHPGFNIPLDGNGSFEDYCIEFAESCSPRALVMDNCYMTNKTRPFTLEGGKKYTLHHSMFDDDAVFLCDMPKEVTLKSSKSRRSVTLKYPDMKYLGLWHKPRTSAPYICIEPWRGVPAYYKKIDDLETKRDMLVLNPGEEYKTHIDIMAD